MAPEDVHARHPNRPLVAIVIATGLAIGILPFLLYRSAAYLLAPYMLFSAIAAWWIGRRFVSRATISPTPLEWLLAGWSSVALGASASMIGFVWYGIAYAAIWAFVYGANAIGWSIAPNPSAGATWLSSVFVAIFALGGPFIVGNELPGKLYPSLAGLRSAFFQFTLRPWTLAGVAAGSVAVLLVGLTFFGLDPHGLAFTALLTAVLLGTAVPLQTPGEDARPTAEGKAAFKALRRLYDAAGYELIEKPRTNDPELDPLVTTIDLLASSDDRAYAVQIVRLDPEAADIDRSRILEVRTGARALQQASQESEGQPARVVPYLFVIGGRVSESQEAFGREMGVSIVHMTDTEALKKASLETDKTRLRELALPVLQVPLADEPRPAQTNGDAGPESP